MYPTGPTARPQTVTMSDSHLTHLTAEQGQMLLDVALQFGATLDLDTLLPLVLTRVTDMLRAERALIALFDLSGEVDRAVVHNLEWGGPGHPLPVSSGLIAQVIRDGRPVVVADASIDEQYQGNLSVRMFGLRFMMGVPIPSRGRVIGALYVDSQASKVEDLQRETALLEAIGRLVGTAAENARLFEELRYRNRLLAAMVHDFRGPLSVILANGELIAGVAQDSEEVEMANDVTACARRMSRMVEHTLELSRLDGRDQGSELRMAALQTELPQHVQNLAIMAQQQSLALTVEVAPDLPAPLTVPDRVWIIVENLVFNALKHAAQGSTVAVVARFSQLAGPLEARTRRDDGVNLFGRLRRLVADPLKGFVEIVVSNEGHPIPDELQAHLFEPWVRGEAAPRGGSSSGLGLTIVDQCARHLGGCVWVESDALQGTRFTFSLPVEAHLGTGDPEAEDNRWRNDTIPMPALKDLRSMDLHGQDTLPELPPPGRKNDS